jgi:hypothetical protein
VPVLSSPGVAPPERITAMNRLSSKQVCLGLAVLACLLSSPAGAAQITYEMVTVGNPGNAGDTRAGVNTFGKGSVAYKYQIGKYDVTIGQYTAFLNAVDPSGTNPNGIYNSSMGTNLNIAGISYDEAAAPESKYSVIGPFGAMQIPQATAANRPITFVSWFNAARFANWMTNGSGEDSRRGVLHPQRGRVVQGRLLLTELRWSWYAGLLRICDPERLGPWQHHRRRSESGELDYRQRVFRDAVADSRFQPELPDGRWSVHQ